MKILHFVTLISLLFVPAGECKADLSAPEARLKAEQFFGEKVKFDAGKKLSLGTTPGRGKNCWGFEAIDENLGMAIDADSGLIIEFHNFSDRLTERPKLTQALTRPQALASAIDYLKKCGVWEENLELFGEEPITHNKVPALFSFQWIKIQSGMRLPYWCTIHIDTPSGEVITYSIDSYEVAVDTTPRVTQEEAVRIAARKINFESEHRVVSSVKAIVPPKGQSFPAQTLAWEVELEGTKTGEYSEWTGQSAVKFTSIIVIDAFTGAILTTWPGRQVSETLLRPPVARPNKYIVMDQWPSWSSVAGGSLYFSTNRPVKSPTGAAGGAFARVSQGKITALIMPGVYAVTYALSGDGNRLAIGTIDHTWIVDFKKGELGRLNDPRRLSRYQASWRPDGKQLVMIGTRSTSTGQPGNLFVSSIAQPLTLNSMRESYCAAPFPGTSQMPVFSPDGKRIVFFWREKEPSPLPSPTKDTSWSLAVVSSSSPKAGEVVKPQIICSGLPYVERLSWLPGGHKILVGYSGEEVSANDAAVREPEIIDLVAKTRTPLKLPVLRDPDLKGAMPLQLRQPMASPDGKTIAFSARRWTGNPKDSAALCIYTCNFDGSALKRITPANNGAIEAFHYPQAGVTAVNAWEKLQPKAVVGPIWDDNDPKTPGSRANRAAWQKKFEEDRKAAIRAEYKKRGWKIPDEEAPTPVKKPEPVAPIKPAVAAPVAPGRK